MLSNNLYDAVKQEVRKRIVTQLIIKYNQLYLQYMNDSNMTEAHYKAKRKVIYEMILDYKCYDDCKPLIKEFEENNR